MRSKTGLDFVNSNQHCMRNNCTIIFVYNEVGNAFSIVSGYVHKMISSKTYHCNLCKITHHNFGMRNEWKSFINKLPFKFGFLNKDQFGEKYKNFITSFPVILVKKNNELHLLASSNEIDACTSTGDLKKLLLSKLSLYDKCNYSDIQ